MKNIYLALLSLVLGLSLANAEEATVDSQTMPQALALFSAGNVNDCEALISSSVSSDNWNSVSGLLQRAKNLIYLGIYAKEQDKVSIAQSIGGAAAQLLDTVVTNLPANDTGNAILQLRIRASLQESLVGNSEQAEQLRQQAAALEPPPTEEPLSPPEE